MRGGIFVLVVGLAALPAVAQESLDDLERRLEAAKKAESAKQAEANRKAEAARRAAAARAALVVRADGDCALKVNGQDKGRLQAGNTTTVAVNAGQQLIECDGGEGRRAEAIESIGQGEQKVVQLSLSERVRFVRVADGVEDREQGVVWAASDNGSDIDWNGATSHCTGKGGGWSLPTVAQAQSLYDASSRYAQARSGHGFNWTIKPATDLIQFSAGASGLWTSERDGSSSEFLVDLGNGYRTTSFIVSASLTLRALCVRRRS